LPFVGFVATLLQTFDNFPMWPAGLVKKANLRAKIMKEFIKENRSLSGAGVKSVKVKT
jgi:hypothetical protein